MVSVGGGRRGVLRRGSLVPSPNFLPSGSQNEKLGLATRLWRKREVWLWASELVGGAIE